MYSGGLHRDIDRGWAWMVLIATYLGVLTFCVPLYMSGVLYLAFLDRFGESETKTSLVGAFNSGLLCFSAPFAVIFNNRFSCRFSIIFGAVLSSLGFVTGAFMPTLDWVIVACGIIVGVGYGITSSGLICVLGFNFDKFRDQALASAFLMVGVGMFVSAPLALYTVSNYGLTTTLVLCGCIHAQICVLGAICRPSVIEKEAKIERKETFSGSSISKTKTFVDFSLLKNKSFLMFMISTSVWNFALNAGIVHLPNFIVTLGGNETYIGFLTMSFSVANLFGRLMGSLSVSKLRKWCLHIHVVVLGVSGILTSLVVFYCRVYGGVLLFAVQLGVFTGWPNSLMTPLSVGFVGVNKMSEAYGLSYLFCGFGVSTGPVVISYLHGLTGSYQQCFIVTGVVVIAGCVCGVGSLLCAPPAQLDDKECAQSHEGSAEKERTVLESLSTDLCHVKQDNEESVQLLPQVKDLSLVVIHTAEFDAQKASYGQVNF